MNRRHTTLVTIALLSMLGLASFVPLRRTPIVYFDQLRLDKNNLLTLADQSRYQFIPFVQHMPAEASLSVILSGKELPPEAQGWEKNESQNIRGYLEYKARPVRSIRMQSIDNKTLDGLEFPPFVLRLDSRFACPIYFAVFSGKRSLTEGVLVVATGATQKTFNTGEKARELISQIGTDRRERANHSDLATVTNLAPHPWRK